MIVVNEVIYPLLKLITLPITILTLGIFALILNLILIKLIDYLIVGFSVNGILTLLFFSLIVSLVTTVLGGKSAKRRKSSKKKK
jgi:putative membrane protein